MGSVNSYTCDSCGDSIGTATLMDAVQIVVVSSNGSPHTIFLCTKPEYKQLNPNKPEQQRMPKYRGCARKVLSKSVLKSFYDEVAEYVGNDVDMPFPI